MHERRQFNERHVTQKMCFSMYHTVCCGTEQKLCQVVKYFKQGGAHWKDPMYRKTESFSKEQKGSEKLLKGAKRFLFWQASTGKSSCMFGQSDLKGCNVFDIDETAKYIFSRMPQIYHQGLTHSQMHRFVGILRVKIKRCFPYQKAISQHSKK